MSNYEVGSVYYLPVVVGGIGLNNNEEYPVEVQYKPSSSFMMAGCVADDPGILLTAEEIAAVINTERDEALEKLKAKVAKLEAENEEWQKTARCYSNNAYSDLELTRKLREENNKLKAENEALTKECDDICEKINELTDMYNSAKAEMAQMSSDYAKLEKKYNKAQEDHEHQEEFWQRDVDSAYSQADKYEERLKQANIKNGNLTEECYKLRRTEKVQRTVIEVLAERVIYLEANADD